MPKINSVLSSLRPEKRFWHVVKLYNASSPFTISSQYGWMNMVEIENLVDGCTITINTIYWD